MVDILKACCVVDPLAPPVSFVSGSDKEDSPGDGSGERTPGAPATAVKAHAPVVTTASAATAIPAPATRVGEAPGLPVHDEWTARLPGVSKPGRHPAAGCHGRREEEMKGEEEDGNGDGGEEWGGGGSEKGGGMKQAIPQDMDQVTG